MFWTDYFWGFVVWLKTKTSLDFYSLSYFNAKWDSTIQLPRVGIGRQAAAFSLVRCLSVTNYLSIRLSTCRFYTPSQVEHVCTYYWDMLVLDAVLIIQVFFFVFFLQAIALSMQVLTPGFLSSCSVLLKLRSVGVCSKGRDLLSVLCTPRFVSAAPKRKE